MNPTRVRGVWATLLGLLFSITAANAGVVPLTASGRVDTSTKLTATTDTIVYRIHRERIEARQTLTLHNHGPKENHLLGLPSDLQDVSVLLPVASNIRKRKAVGSKNVSWWVTFPVRIPGGQSIDLDITWWLPHKAVERYGYWRFRLEDPLFTCGTWHGSVGYIERRIYMSEGVAYVDSTPEAPPVQVEGEKDWEQTQRAYILKEARPASDARLLVLYRITKGVFSHCQGGNPAHALDGDPTTVWKPSKCPGGKPALNVLANCHGLGSGDLDCNRNLSSNLTMGVSVRTANPKNRQPVILEAYWGSRRVWRKRGVLNQPIAVMKQDPVTHYRFIYPSGSPPDGAGDINLLRIDLGHSSKGSLAVLTSRGQTPRADENCQLNLRFVNPVSLRHITLMLRPKIQPRDWFTEVDCLNSGEEIYHEPFTHPPHTKEELGKLIHLEKLKDYVDIEHHDHHHHDAKPFKRKNPNKIELDADPTCMVKTLKVQAVVVFCTQSKLNPRVPRIRLVY